MAITKSEKDAVLSHINDVLRRLGTRENLGELSGILKIINQSKALSNLEKANLRSLVSFIDSRHDQAISRAKTFRGLVNDLTVGNGRNIVMSSNAQNIAAGTNCGGSRRSLDEVHFRNWLNNNGNTGRLPTSYADSTSCKWSQGEMTARHTKSNGLETAFNFHHPLPAGGANSVELKYKVSATNWRPGESGKLMGLAYWMGGGAPGGGTVHSKASSICPAWEDFNRSTESGIADMIKSGPYIYCQDSRTNLPGQLWYGPNYSDGHLRWQVKPHPTSPKNYRNAPFSFTDMPVRIRIEETGVSGSFKLVNLQYHAFGLTLNINGLRWRKSSAPGKAVTHLHARSMYGGNHNYMPNLGGNIHDLKFSDVEIEYL